MAEDDNTVAQKIKDKRTRVQRVKAVHEKASKDRADAVSNLKAAYLANRDNPVVLDILEKAAKFMAYHEKIAKDGFGARKTGFKLENGQDEFENFYLTAEKRVNELEKAAGIQELLDYIERMRKVDVPPPNPDLQQAVDNAEADAADTPAPAST